MSLTKRKRELEAAQSAGRWEDVSNLCSEVSCFDIGKKSIPRNHPQVGKLLCEQGKYREALDYHRREQEVCNEQGGSEMLLRLFFYILTPFQVMTRGRHLLTEVSVKFS